MVGGELLIAGLIVLALGLLVVWAARPIAAAIIIYGMAAAICVYAGAAAAAAREEAIAIAVPELPREFDPQRAVRDVDLFAAQSVSGPVSLPILRFPLCFLDPVRHEKGPCGSPPGVLGLDRIDLCVISSPA